jgi:Carboxypeptidase regulatory-like domain
MLKQMGKVMLAVAATMLLAATAWSQAIFATLTGVVTDPTGAVVPQAKITLRNAASGDTRNTVADQQGYYTFASVPVGAYNLTVTQAGFQTFEEDGIPLGGGESRSVNVSLQVGNTSQTVQVSGGKTFSRRSTRGSGP